MPKLFNSGERTIDEVFKPKTTMNFTPAAAEKIKKLYRDEVKDLDDVVNNFENPPANAEAEEAAKAEAEAKAKKPGAKTKAKVEEDSEESDDDTIKVKAKAEAEAKAKAANGK